MHPTPTSPSKPALRRSLVCALVAIGAAACGNAIREDDGDGGSAATTTGGGPTGTTTSSGTTSSGTTTGGAMCAPFADAIPRGQVDFHIHNDTGLPIYLPLTCGQLSYEVLTSLSATAVVPGDRTCLATCEDRWTTDPPDCAACAPESHRLQPGEVLDVRWDGLGLETVDMPAACFHSANGGTSCQQLVGPPLNGVYSVRITAYPSCGDGGCTCDATGRCDAAVSGQGSFFDPAANEFVFSADTGGSKDVYFGPCPFGCAEN